MPETAWKVIAYVPGGVPAAKLTPVGRTFVDLPLREYVWGRPTHLEVAGSPEQSSVTSPLNPLTGVSSRFMTAVPGAVKVCVAGVAVTMNTGVTVKVW